MADVVCLEGLFHTRLGVRLPAWRLLAAEDSYSQPYTVKQLHQVHTCMYLSLNGFEVKP